jgi:hypothetical protein
MMRITGYQYKADFYCPSDLINLLIAQGKASPAARDMEPEDVLDQIAGAEAVDREDEYSFDTDEFPKRVYSLEDDDCYCGVCGEKFH